MEWCVQHDRFKKFAAIFILAYSFQLRAPSELLGATIGKGSGPIAIYSEGSRTFSIEEEEKQDLGQSVVVECACCASRLTCPRHLGYLLQGAATGEPLFEGITPARTLDVLRGILKRLDVPSAEL